ncbi:NAD-dependent epimerase/dehydratase family protein [Pedobacter sp. MR2016-24]|uniref:NAD-dependent epimerase/dehydratase family protein n=1 Tax=Pedobacter sp. MR2016-24 TaxID=2994466 RepID=UPI002245F079|nr:SDR family NAD(P)-dependent oxidoreductase [Pedobacter sp. MR2016-24]MCX2483443.1 SDR family NAD(P)-dependent oxidoreductase [Pedobacter sp. MR2016-24]
MNIKHLPEPASIFEKIWELSPERHIPEASAMLLQLTKKLISIYDAEGRLDENPFTPTTKRKLNLPVHKIQALLSNSTCLVTGGAGCVGSTLVKRLVELGAGKVIIADLIDKSPDSSSAHQNVITVLADVRDRDALNDVFEKYKPDYVFHTAAQRDPGYAETHIEETISLNIMGTLNLVNICESHKSVKQCVFSSTGKASRYYTSEVYAATKKMCEYIFDTYAQQSSVRYSMVRFTHILENSLMNSELQHPLDKDYLAIHSPGKYVTAQNVREAADLMLNALLSSKVGRCNFLIVKNLEWPVESLEVALYYIKQSGAKIPVIFKGNPPGYCEKFFRGQMDWAHPLEMNLLINVYEQRYRYENEEADMIISGIVPTNKYILQNALIKLSLVKGEKKSKECLLLQLKNIVRASLDNVEQSDTVNILQWGLNPQYLAAEGTIAADYEPAVSILNDSLNPHNSSNSAIYGQYINC